MWPFRKPKPKPPFKPNVNEIVRIAISNHPSECEFFGGREAAAAAAIAEIGDISGLTESQALDRIVAAIQRQESYCPHEGIDRR